MICQSCLEEPEHPAQSTDLNPLWSPLEWTGTPNAPQPSSCNIRTWPHQCSHGWTIPNPHRDAPKSSRQPSQKQKEDKSILMPMFLESDAWQEHLGCDFSQVSTSFNHIFATYGRLTTGLLTVGLQGTRFELLPWINSAKWPVKRKLCSVLQSRHVCMSDVKSDLWLKCCSLTSVPLRTRASRMWTALILRWALPCKHNTLHHHTEVSNQCKVVQRWS